MKLKDKVAIVTGAASGLGKAIATFATRAKARRSSIADLNKRAGGGGGRRDQAEEGGQAIGVAMDVTSEEAVDRGVPPRWPPSAASTSWSATPASRSCIRWRNSLRRMEEDAGDPRRRRVPHDQGVPAAHVPVGPRRQRHLHGVGALARKRRSSRRRMSLRSTASWDSPRVSPRRARSTACAPT